MSYAENALPATLQQASQPSDFLKELGLTPQQNANLIEFLRTGDTGKTANSVLISRYLQAFNEGRTGESLAEAAGQSGAQGAALDAAGVRQDADVNAALSGQRAGELAEGAGDFNRLLKQSTCSSDDFYKYLNKINSDYADTYAKTGKWPSDVQIPKNPDVLKADGTINWDEVPNGGYVLDGKGDAIKEQYVPGIGETIDRHGPNNGRFTSPVRNNKPYSYAQRSLPYMENPSQYHRYKVTGDLSNIEQYFIKSTDANLKQMISAYMKKFRLSFSDLETYRGEIASGFGEIGGGEQYELPLPVNMLEGLGLLKEF